MDIQEEGCIDKVVQFQWIWCKEMDTQEERVYLESWAIWVDLV